MQLEVKHLLFPKEIPKPKDRIWWRAALTSSMTAVTGTDDT